MEMVMQPANGNPGVVLDSDKNNGCHGHHDHHGHRNWDEAKDGTVQRHGLAALDHAQQNGHENRASIERNGMEVRGSIEHHGLRALEATKDALKDILIHTSNQNMQLHMKMCEEFRESQVEAAKNYAALQLESAKQFGLVQLEAQKNKAELEKEILKGQLCCAETKQFIAEKACHTEELLRSQEKDRLAAEVARLHEELTALRIRATLSPPPVATAAL